MKKITLTEDELTKIISRVIKEQGVGKCSGGSYWENEGYKSMNGLYVKPITPAISFYIKGTPRAQDNYCNFTLSWSDVMRPINIGGPDFCYGIAEAYEEAFKMKRAQVIKKLIKPYIIEGP